MKTKIVYVLVSSDNDIYLEQAWVSLFSLRHFNKDAVVEMVCDERTSSRINKQGPVEFRNMVDNIVSVPFAETVSNRERSRFLKTNLRKLIDGNFLFLDTDTIITDSLEEVDAFDFNLGMVYSWHCKMKDRPSKAYNIKRIKRLYNISIKDSTEYFNSGVIYSKDSEKSRLFFEKWHSFWQMSKNKPGGIQDQSSLAVTVNELGGVHAMSGDYNCQPIYSMKHIATAKIVHFFNLKWDDNIRSPFNNDKFYLEIKKAGCISESCKQLILTCRSTFIAPSMCICGDDINIWNSNTFKLLRKIYRNHKNIYKGLNYLSKKLVRRESRSF